MHLKSFFFLLVAGISFNNILYAQDLSSVKSAKPFTFHGSLGAGANFYSSNQPFQSQDPFSWNVYGSFTPTTYGVSLPFSFVVTQYSKSYTSPFTQFGISPSYRWIKLHLGYRSISYSPFVFDGQSFLGAGIELTPGKFYFSSFYGRLNKAITEDTTFEKNRMPQYARTGYGFKIGYGNTKQNLSVQFLHAKDDTTSIQRIKDSLTTILPQENTVLGSSWHFLFFKKLTFTGDVAVSLLNRDMSYQRIDTIGYVKVPTFTQKIQPINYSSVLSYSGQSMLTLVLRNLNVSAGYRRIEPDFVSLGVPYMLNDVEMLTGNIATTFFKGRLSVNAMANSQHNNLERMLASELQTKTGNVGINAFVSNHVNLNLNFMGVSVYQKNGLLQIPDSIRMNQLMWNATLSPVFTFSNQRHQQTVSASFNYTDLNDKNPTTSSQSSTQSIAASLNYSLFFNKGFWGINSTEMYSEYKQLNNTYQSVGMNGGIMLQLLKQHNLSIQGTAGYFLNKSMSGTVGNNTTFSFNTSYSQKKNSFGIYLSYILTPPVNLNPLNVVYHVPIAVNSRNFTGGINYGFHF